MSNAKYTKGPWGVKRTKVGMTPTVCAKDGIVFSVDRSPEELLANANLAAAAPEMAEALKTFIKVFASYEGWSEAPFVKARAALEKAGIK